MPEVVVYSRRWCSHCWRAKALLRKKGVEYREIDVGLDPEREREMVRRSGGRRTVPQVFVGGKHVGGFDELHALEARGRLDALLTEDD